MWQRLVNRAGRVLLSIIVAGVVQYVSNSKYALILAPVLSTIGKWLREKGFNYIPF